MNKEQQEKDFEQIKAYANPNCKHCYGTGKLHWFVEIQHYQVCPCVEKNIELARMIMQRGMN